MRFGTFIPQGWRFDLVGIDPADQWAVMAALAAAGRRGSVGVALGLRPLPHRARRRARGGDPRGVDADGRVRRRRPAASASARCARAWATATPPTSRRSPRPSTSSRAAASRWASAAAGTSTSGAPTATGSRRFRERLAMLREGVEIMRQAWTTGDGDPRRRALPGRRRDRAAAAAAGGRHPALDRRRRREGDAEDRGEVRRSTRTSPARIEEFDAQERDPARALRRARHATSRRSRARRTSTRSSARPRPRRRSPRRGEGATAAATSAEERADAIEHDYRTSDAGSARPSRSSSGSPRGRARLGYAIHYFPEAAYDRSGIELWARGHSRAAVARGAGGSAGA